MALGKVNVSPVIVKGDMRESLVALRDRVAVELDNAGPCFECERSDPKLVATLTKELREVLAAIDTLPVPEGASRIDELANARKAKQAPGRRKRPASPAARPAVSQ